MPDRETDLRWLALACDLAQLCPPSDTAFSVGAVMVDAQGRELSRAHSRETDPKSHAEESALLKLFRSPPEGSLEAELAGATIYSSLEPCGRRLSRPKPCAQLIVEAGIRRVAYAWREPSLFVPGDGDEVLRAAGVEVLEIEELAQRAMAPNRHLLR